MNRLTLEQRQQVRKDLADLLDQVLVAEASGMVPGWAKKAARLQYRVTETVAIAAGAFDESEDVQNG